MADRVTTVEVQEIIDTDRSDISMFITAANLLVTERMGSNTDIPDDLKKEIERWLAAHFIAIADKSADEEQIGDAKVKYAGKTGMGLQATRYGQMALSLDATGTLASLGKRNTGFQVILPDE